MNTVVVNNVEVIGGYAAEIKNMVTAQTIFTMLRDNPIMDWRVVKAYLVNNGYSILDDGKFKQGWEGIKALYEKRQNDDSKK